MKRSLKWIGIGLFIGTSAFAQTDSTDQSRRRVDEGILRHSSDTAWYSKSDSMRTRDRNFRQPNRGRIDSNHVQPPMKRRSGTIITPGDTLRRKNLEIRKDSIH